MYIFKKHNLGLISAILLAAMAVVSCQGETPPVANPPTLRPSPTLGSTPTSGSEPTLTSRPTLQPTPSPREAILIATPQPGASCLSCGPIEERAREALANWLGISSEEIEVIEVEEVEWPDTTLGCPQPGMAYLQVITPGWRVVMRVNDEVYEYHSGGGDGVLCDQEGHLTSILPSPTVTATTIPGAPTPTLEDVCPVILVAPHGRRCPRLRMPPD